LSFPSLGSPQGSRERRPEEVAPPDRRKEDVDERKLFEGHDPNKSCRFTDTDINTTQFLDLDKAEVEGKGQGQTKHKEHPPFEQSRAAELKVGALKDCDPAS
jgi:hypothetical protein